MFLRFLEINKYKLIYEDVWSEAPSVSNKVDDKEANWTMSVGKLCNQDGCTVKQKTKGQSSREVLFSVFSYYLHPISTIIWLHFSENNFTLK